MSTKADNEILPEDKIQLNQDQENLITLAFAKQIPVDDAEFIEKIQKQDRPSTGAYIEIEEYFTKKYGEEFGRIFLATITGGEASYKNTIEKLEKERAQKRIRLGNSN